MSRRHCQRVMLIGWDAADWGFLRPLLDAGKMPVLQSLIERGVSGNLATIRPMLSPMLWNTVATGKRADKHGILGFAEPSPDGRGIRPVTSTSRTCKALWNILSQNGMASVVVNWFASHPAEPIRGAVVTDRYETASIVPEAKRAISDAMFHPASLRAALEDQVVSPDLLDAGALLPFVPHAAEIDFDRDDRLGKLAGLLSRTSTVHTAACHAMMSCAWNLMAVYYPGIDHFGHLFMPYHPPAMPGVSATDARLYGGVMEACYRYHDMMLQALLQYAGPETTVLLVSDHGFHHDATRPGANGMDNPVGWHRQFGVAVAAGPGVRRGETLYGATLLDIAPTVLTALGLPVGSDMDGRVWNEVFEEPDHLERIVSWELLPGDDGRHPPEVREDPVAAAEAIRHLVDLGYLDDPGPDAQKAVDNVILDQKHNLALALTDSAYPGRAIPIWEELIAQAAPDDPARTHALLYLATCHLKLDDFAACRRTLDRLDAAQQDLPQVRLLRGKILQARGEHDAACELFRRLQEEAPQIQEVSLLLGRSYLHLKRYDEAQAAYQAAHDRTEYQAQALDGLSRVALARQDYPAAVRYALESVGLVHHHPQAHLQLAEALAASGDKQTAAQAVAVALSMAPRSRRAHRLCARWGLDLGEGESWRHRLLADRPAAARPTGPDSLERR